MILIKVWRPRAGLKPRSYRRVSAALGLSLASALTRLGFRVSEAYAWRGTPDAAAEKLDVEIKRDAVREIAQRLERLSGVTITLEGRLGPAELAVDVDIYADSRVPVLAAATKEEAEVLAEPRGYAGETPIHSFYQLLDIAPEDVKALLDELLREIHYKELKVATYAGVRTHPLWRLTARISATRDSTPEDAVPLWYRPWTRQLAKDLYRASPPELRRLLGPPGMQKAVKDMAHNLLKYLQQYYEVEHRAHEGALVLFPKPSSLLTESHRRATAALRGLLREALTEAAGRGAEEIIKREGRLSWQRLVEAFRNALAQRLKTHA